MRLDSWKQIAGYLKRDVRTVERWAAQKGLPVHRIAGDKGLSVFAYTGELDAWLLPTPPNGGPAAGPVETPAAARRYRWAPLFLVAGAIGAAVMWALVALARSPGQVQSLQAEGAELVARDARGRIAWRHAYQGAILKLSPRIGGPGAAGGAAVVAGLDVVEASYQRGLLEGFSLAGRRLWTYSAPDTLAFADAEYGPPWGSMDVLRFETGGQARVAWALHHHTWWPSFVVVLDAQGRPLQRFAHAGWITNLGLTADGKYVLATGINQESGGIMLAVIDANRAEGCGPTGDRSSFACRHSAPGGPVSYFVFPRPELAGAGSPQAVPSQIKTYPDGHVELRVVPAAGMDGAEIIYEFSPALALRTATPSERYWDWHRRAESRGEIGHRAEECPERRGSEAREWTPAHGWQAVRVPSLAAGSAR